MKEETASSDDQLTFGDRHADRKATHRYVDHID